MSKVEADIHMHILPPNIRNHLGDHDPALGLTPAHDLAQETESVRLDAHGHVLALVAADFLHFRVLGPRADRDLDELLVNIDEPCIRHPLLQAVPGRDVPSPRFSGSVAQLLPLEHVGCQLHGPIVTLTQRKRLLKLYPTTGLSVRVRLPHQLVPVGDAARHGSAVDKVKGLVGTVDPFRLGIVNVELDVGRHPRWLDGTEISAYDLCSWVLVGEVYGPDAGAGADVEHALGRRRDGCIVELAA